MRAATLYSHRLLTLDRPKDKWASIASAILIHVLLLLIGGRAFITPAQYGVNLGDASVEVNLVAPPPEVAPQIAPEPVIEPDIAEAIAPDVEAERVVEHIRKEEPKPASTAPSEGAHTVAKPIYLKNNPPYYPRTALQNGWEGTVLLKVSVNIHGSPEDVHVLKSSGHDVLDKSALRAVKRWRFEPARMGNIPIATTIQVPIKFVLKDYLKKQ